MLKNMVDVLFYGSLAARVDNRAEMITMLAENDAKTLLDLMEKLGMLPPLHPNVTDIWDQNFTMSYNWEDETED